MIYDYPGTPSGELDQLDSGVQYLGSRRSRTSLFEDRQFPATGRSLNFRGRTPMGWSWLRPHEIVENPVFVDEGATHYDMSQGELGDCWFVAAAATIAATNRKLITRIIMPERQGFGSGYTGRFVFKFWQYDRWMEVEVDDRLPTRGRRLVYAHNRENPREFWCPLLEKAYAKFYGCYEALGGGKIHVAFVDMSGGISEMVELDPDKTDASDLFTTLQQMFTMNSLLGGAIFNSRRGATREVERTNGLFEGHAYSITEVRQLVDNYGNKHLLLRVRNPWGRGEWKGPWSDRSREWSLLPSSDTEELRRKVSDGEFWISMEDFIANFNEIELTHLIPDALTDEVAEDTNKKRWETTVHRDAWVRGVSAGGCGNPPHRDLYWMNPQFRLTLDPATNGSTVVISLMEIKRDRFADINIGFGVYQLRPGEPEEPLGEDYERRALVLRERSGTYSPYREVTVRMELKPGKYVIIPTTFHPHKESEFFLRIFAEKKASSWPFSWVRAAPSRADEPGDLIRGLFEREVGSHKLADPLNLRDILNVAIRRSWNITEGFELETCRSLLASKDATSKDGLIDLATVRSIWDQLEVWRKIFLDVETKKERGVTTYDLKDLYRAIDFPVGRNALRSIARRYGGHTGKISFEDFVNSSAKVIAMTNSFQAMSPRGAGDTVTFDLEQWLAASLYQ